MSAPLDRFRRYWFVDVAALDAVTAALDVPDWGDAGIATLVFCLDDASHAALCELDEGGEGLAIVDARDPATLGSSIAKALAGELAPYVQFARRAVEDFAPGLECLGEIVERSAPQAIQAMVAPIDRCAVGQEPIAVSEGLWIATEHMRQAAARLDAPNARELIALTEEIGAGEEALSSPLLVGAAYRLASEQGDCDEAMERRARNAAAHAENDRLISERRVRLGREAALRARAERDLARQADRYRAEIDRLYQAAGWAGRWKARFGRLFGRR